MVELLRRNSSVRPLRLLRNWLVTFRPAVPEGTSPRLMRLEEASTDRAEIAADEATRVSAAASRIRLAPLMLAPAPIARVPCGAALVPVRTTVACGPEDTLSSAPSPCTLKTGVRSFELPVALIAAPDARLTVWVAASTISGADKASADPFRMLTELAPTFNVSPLSPAVRAAPNMSTEAPRSLSEPALTCKEPSGVAFEATT